MLGILKDVTYNYEDYFKALNITLKFSDYSLNFRLEPTAPNPINTLISGPDFEGDIGQNIKRIEFEIYDPTHSLGENYSVDEVHLSSIFSFVEKENLFFKNVLKVSFIEDTEFKYEARYSPFIISHGLYGLNQPLSLYPDWREITFNAKVSIDYGN